MSDPLAKTQERLEGLEEATSDHAKRVSQLESDTTAFTVRIADRRKAIESRLEELDQTNTATQTRLARNEADVAASKKFSWSQILATITVAFIASGTIAGLIQFADFAATKDLRVQIEALQKDGNSLRSDLATAQGQTEAWRIERGEWMRNQEGRTSSIETTGLANSNNITALKSYQSSLNTDRWTGTDMDRYISQQQHRDAAQDRALQFLTEYLLKHTANAPKP